MMISEMICVGAADAGSAMSFGNILIVVGAGIVILAGLYCLISGNLTIQKGRKANPAAARVIGACVVVAGAIGVIYGLVSQS